LRIDYQGHVWEVDEFLGENAGLVVAEIELSGADDVFARPDWIGEEVTGDPRYYNSSLIRLPYSLWKNNP
jgi:CYTH domain-containing protein